MARPVGNVPAMNSTSSEPFDLVLIGGGNMGEALLGGLLGGGAYHADDVAVVEIVQFGVHASCSSTRQPSCVFFNDHLEVVSSVQDYTSHKSERRDTSRLLRQKGPPHCSACESHLSFIRVQYTPTGDRLR